MRISLYGKMIGSFLAVLILFGAVVVVTYTNVKKIEADLQQVPHDVMRMEQIQQIQHGVMMKQAAVRSYLLTGKESYRSDFQNYAQANRRLEEEIINTAIDRQNKAIAARIRELDNQITNRANQVFALAAAGRVEQAKALADSGGLLAEGGLNAVVDDFMARRQKKIEQETAGSIAAALATRRAALILNLVALLFGLVVAVLLAGYIIRRVKRLVAGAERIAAGDLSGEAIPVKTSDELDSLADAFNRMQQNLKVLVGQVSRRAGDIDAMSDQLADNTQQVSRASAEAAASISQIASTVEQVTENAQQVAAAARQADELAGAGREQMEQVNVQVGEMADSSRRVKTAIDVLNQTAVDITRILDLITRIADQTNLLALNAAIEAARAGEHGRGFAVVAEEVRQLAEQSNSSAREIYSLISRTQQETKEAMEAITVGGERVQVGLQTVERAKASFEEILQKVREAAEGIQQVAAAAEEMSSGVQNVAATAEEQNASMEEVSAAGESLRQLAADLRSEVNKFKL